MTSCALSRTRGWLVLLMVLLMSVGVSAVAAGRAVAAGTGGTEFADVNGAGQPDFVALRSTVNGPATLSVTLPSGLFYSTRVAADATPWTDLVDQVGNVNAIPGDELFVQNGNPESLYLSIYTFDAGQLINAGPALTVSSDQNGPFSEFGVICSSQGGSYFVTQRAFSQSEYGPDTNTWYESDTVYVWQGARLVQYSTSSHAISGTPPASETGLQCGAPASSPDPDQGATLSPNESLFPGWYLQSPNGQYRLEMQGDGNLVLSSVERPLWSSHTAGDDGASVTMQPDGNLVISLNGVPKWASHTAGFPGAGLLLGDSGRLVVADGGRTLWRWQSGYVGDKLFPGEALTPGQQLVSANRRDLLIMQDDGNLVLYGPRYAIWSSHTAGDNGAYVTMQRDGNLVVYYQGTPRWASNTAGHPGAFLDLRGGGHLAIYHGRHRLWRQPHH